MKIFFGTLLLLAGFANASEYVRDGGTADFMCCSDKACTTIISQHPDPVRARDACGELTDGDGVTRWTRSNAFKISVGALEAPVLSGTVSPNTADPTRSNVTLDWTMVPDATAYTVERCTGSCTSWIVLTPSTGALTYLNNNLPGGITFGYRVRGFTSNVQGPNSNKVTITTPTAPPPPPQGSATLQWTPPTENTDGSALTNLAGYTIVFGNSPTTLSQTINLTTPSVSSYVVPNLAPGTWYFALEAVNALDEHSTRTNPVNKVIP